jgi:hypothetical protein
MDLTQVREWYFNDRFQDVLGYLSERWPKSGLPAETYGWADACFLGMVSAFHFANEAGRIGDADAEGGWVRQGDLWRARSIACAFHSHNLYAGALNVLGLANLASYEKHRELAVQIADLVSPLLERAAPAGAAPVSEYVRICAENRAGLLCDAILSRALSGTLDEAIAEARKALECCGDDTRARVKVSGGIANMTWWNGDQKGGIAQTEAVLKDARAHHLDFFAGIAEDNLQMMRDGKDEFRAYQVA